MAEPCGHEQHFGFGRYRCELPKDHAGRHQEGGCSWSTRFAHTQDVQEPTAATPTLLEFAEQLSRMTLSDEDATDHLEEAQDTLDWIVNTARKLTGIDPQYPKHEEEEPEEEVNNG
jgi:hypothetical protein